MLIFKVQDSTHEIGWLGMTSWQRPGEPLSGRKLTGSPPTSWVKIAPKLHKSGYRPRTPVQAQYPHASIGKRCEQLGPGGEPVHKHAGFNVAQTAGEGIVSQNSAKQRRTLPGHTGPPLRGPITSHG